MLRANAMLRTIQASRRLLRYVGIGGLVVSLTACDYFKPKIPPNQLYNQAEQLRQNKQYLEAAQGYDALAEQYKDSELASAALYYAGFCKYTLMLQTPGSQAFKQRKDGLSPDKKKLYEDALAYMDDHRDNFTYLAAVDKYLYQGHEFTAVLEQYPASNFRDDAAFQLAHLAISAQQQSNALAFEDAVQRYADFMQQYPESPFRAKGIEQLLELITNNPTLTANYAKLAPAYQELLKGAANLPDVGKLSYLLATKALTAGDPKNAAIILGVPTTIGLGFVNTEQTNLNIRSGEGTQYRIVTKANKNEQVILISKNGQ